MPDTVASQTLHDGGKKLIMKFTYTYVDTGESAVLKVDVSGLNNNRWGDPCTSVSIEKIQYHIGGLDLNILWDATTDLAAWTFYNNGSSDSGELDFSDKPLVNNAGTGVTGDIKFTVANAAAGESYDVVLTMLKHYG
jgi:hypothetical protein